MDQPLVNDPNQPQQQIEEKETEQEENIEEAENDNEIEKSNEDNNNDDTVEHVNESPTKEDCSTGPNLSTGITMSEEEWKEFKSKKPLEPLQLLLKTKTSSEKKSISSTTSAGEHSESSKVNLLQELRTKVLEVDLFQAIEEDHMVAFKIEDLLHKLNNPMASTSLIGFLASFEPLLEQITKDLEKKKKHASLKEQESAMKLETWTAVEASQNKISSLQTKAKTEMKAVEGYDAEITGYQKEIDRLESLIRAAKKKKSSVLRGIKTSEMLEAEVNQEATHCLGLLEKFNAHETRVNQLIEEVNFIKTRLEQAKALFEDLKNKLVL